MAGPARLGVTLGCPCGIGPEVVARALTMLRPQGRWAIFGAPDAWTRAVSTVGRSLPWTTCTAADLAHCDADLCLVPSADPSQPFTPGAPDDAADAAAARALTDALDAAKQGVLGAVATGPVRKRCFSLMPGGPYPGHTELFHASLGRSLVPVMLFVAPGMRLALHTIHLPLSAVPAAVNPDALQRSLHTLHHGLQQDFGIQRPCIHVLGLNPHASEDGLIGREDVDVVAPFVAHARQQGMDVHGPFPADGFFARYRRQDAPDAVLALYHDQGLGPFKMWERGRGCQTTLELTVPRTSCDHGTAYARAGQGGADARSMVASMRLAMAVAQRRAHRV